MIFKKDLSIPAVILSAILVVFSHPTVFFAYHFPDLHYLAWVSYVPLFLVLLGRDFAFQWRRLVLFGYLVNFGALYWLYTALNSYGHLSPAISILALFILMTLLTVPLPAMFGIVRFLERRLKISAFWSLPLAWVAFQWLLGRWSLSICPWAQAGYTQAWSNRLIQISDLTGVYGVTALVVWGNLAILELTQGLLKKNVKPILPKLCFVVLLMGATFSYGIWAQKYYDRLLPQMPRIKLALIQGNISQDEKWLSQKAREILQTYQEMTDRAFSQGAKLVIWPESSFPYDLALDRPEQVKHFGSYSGDLIAGAVTYNFQETMRSGLSHPHKIYNTALLIRPPGELAAAYHKQHLVPYGEYIPFKSIIPFLEKLTTRIGEFQPGNTAVSLNSGEARMGALICYEDIFPEISRQHTRAGANLLINMTNAAWYGDSSALPQHLNFSPFRAVENRRSLVRATNNGITASVDPLGKIRKTISPFERGTLIDEVSLVSEPTFYVKWGDVFAYGCMGIVGMMLIMALGRKIRKKY